MLVFNFFRDGKEVYQKAQEQIESLRNWIEENRLTINLGKIY